MWEQFSSTDERVALEASALAALYRDVTAYPEPDGSRLQADLREYTRNVIDKSWPLQRANHSNGSQRNPLEISDGPDLLPAQHVFREHGPCGVSAHLNHLVELRRMRLHDVESGLPSSVWIVVALGAVITWSVGGFSRRYRSVCISG